MNNKNRKILIAGNWKMNKNMKETEQFLQDMKLNVNDLKSDVLFCVPYTNLQTALKIATGSKIKIAAQNCHFKESGAYTGEISLNMLKEIGVSVVLLGHSERRQYFNETDFTVNLKLKAALNEGFKVILCVGEDLEQRKCDVTYEIVTMQIKRGLKDVLKEQMKDVVIAYEPIWAIGTGENALPQDAEDVCRQIRLTLKDVFDEEVSQNSLILYGGSMKSNNCDELLKQENIDGGLIGGSSLKVEEFLKILKVADSIV